MANPFFGNQNNLICDFLISSKNSFSLQPCHLQENYDEQIGSVKDSFEIPQKLTIRIDLGSPSLVTNMRIIMTDQEIAEKKFILMDILGNQLGDTTETQRLLRLDQNEDKYVDPSSYSISLKGAQAQKVKNQLKIQAYGVTKVIQISFLINKGEFFQQSHDQSEDGSVVMNQDFNYEKKIDLETGVEEFKKLFDSIQIYGYSLFQSPSQNQGIQLLNISNIFQKYNRQEESVETDIILGYALMSQRKYIQAAEIFKRCSLYFYKQYELNSCKKTLLQDNQYLNQSPLNSSPNKQNSNLFKTEQFTQFKMILKQIYLHQENTCFINIILNLFQTLDKIEDTFNQSNNFGNIQGNDTSNQKLLRAAKLELLVADCIKQPHLINLKVQAYQRATEYFQGQRLAMNSSQQNADAYTNILMLCPYLCKFLLKTLDERIDPLRVSAIKGIEFLIDNLGCTISNQLPQILKQVILTYPLIPACSIDPNRQFDDDDDNIEEEFEENDVLGDRFEEGGFGDIHNEDGDDLNNIRAQKKLKKSKKNGGQCSFEKSYQTQTSINQRVIFEMYYNLLDQFLNLLASASSQILRSIFNDVISTQLFNNEVAHDVKIYLCKITDKIISICQGDLTITPQFIQNMMHYLLNAQQQQQFTNQFKLHLERTWDNIKSKLLSNLELSQANRIVDLIFENLQHILENQGESATPSCVREQQIDQDTEFNFWIEITSIVIQREKRTQDNLPSNFARYSKKLEQSQENLNLKILIQPFLQILEQTIVHPSSIETFKIIWQILVEILISSSSKQQTEYTLSNVAYSILNKTKQFIINHPPPVLQLSALIIIISSLPQVRLFQNLFKITFKKLKDILDFILFYISDPIISEITFLLIIQIFYMYFIFQNKQKEIDITLRKELIDLLFIFLGYVPHSIYEETLYLVDCLFDKIDSLDQNLIEKILIALIDQYTMKNKSQKKVVQNFIAKIMKADSQTKQINHFSYILEICLIKNIEPIKEDNFSQFGGIFNDNLQTKTKNQLVKGKQKKKNVDSKLFEKQYDQFIDKIQFLQDCLDHLNQIHFVVLITKNQDSLVSESIIKFINSKDSKVRLKGFSIIKKIHEHFVELSEPQIRKLEKVLNNYLNIKHQYKSDRLQFQDEWFNESKNDSERKSTSQEKNQSKVNTSIASKQESNLVLGKNNSSKNEQQKDEEENNKSNRKIFSFAKIMITRLIIACIKASFEDLKDPKQQFNSLVLMDQFFQNLFGGPDLESEMKFALQQNKNQKNQKKIQIIDLETYEFTLDQYFEYDSEWYLHMRLNQILKLWPLLQNLVNSPWSNIRSLTYGVICNWVKFNIIFILSLLNQIDNQSKTLYLKVRTDLNHYKSSSQKKFILILFRLLLSLLQSKESECRTGGLNILGSLCGLSYSFDENIDQMRKYLKFFRRHQSLISLSIWETIYDIQSDWDVTNQAAAMIIIQICAPRDSIRHFFRLKQEDVSQRYSYQLNSQNLGHSNINSKENRTITPTLQLGKDENNSFGNDSGTKIKSFKQNQHQNSLSQYNNEQTPIRGFYSQIGEIDDNQFQNNNMSNDSIAADNNSDEETSQNNLDEYDRQNGNGDSNNSQDDLFWFDTASEKEIRDMISMFRGEQKPPVTLWIERDTYNTEHKQFANIKLSKIINNILFKRPEGTTITEVITYTMNEEEDAGIYGYFDEVGLSNNNNGNQINNNQNSLTQEYIQQQQANFQQMKKINSKGLDLLQERVSKENKIYQKQGDNTPPNEQQYQVQNMYSEKQEQVQFKLPQSSQPLPRSSEIQREDSKQMQKFNKFDDEELDYDKLGIIEMEEDDEFIDHYEKTLQEYKKQKNPQQIQAQDANRPSTSKVPQRNLTQKQNEKNEEDVKKIIFNKNSSKQEEQKKQLLDKLDSGSKLIGKVSSMNKNSQIDEENDQKSNMNMHSDYSKYQTDKMNKQTQDKIKIINKNDTKYEDKQLKQNNGDTLKQYKYQQQSQGRQSCTNAEQNQQINQQVYSDEETDPNEFIIDDNDDEYDEDYQEDSQEEIDEEYIDFSHQKSDDKEIIDLKYESFTKIQPNNNQKISQNQQKKDNSRYTQHYSSNDRNSKQSSQLTSSEHQNSSSKRLKEGLQSFGNSSCNEGDQQKQILFNQRMNLREAIQSDENKESLSYTQNSQPNQRRRDTFEVTLSFSDSSIFRDENTDKTITKEDEQINMQQQQIYNSKFSDSQNNSNFHISDAPSQRLTPQKYQNLKENTILNQAEMNQRQEQNNLQLQQVKKQNYVISNNQPFNNSSTVNENQIQQKEKFNQQVQGNKTVNQNNANTGKSTITQVRNTKTPPVQRSKNENQNILNQTSPIPSTHSKSQEKPAMPPNNTPRVNQSNKSQLNNVDINTMKSKIPQSQSQGQRSSGGLQNQLNESFNSGQKQKNQSYSPSDRGIIIQQSSPYRQQMQQQIEQQRLNYHHSNQLENENTQKQLINAIQQQVQQCNQYQIQTQKGGSKSPQSSLNQLDKKQRKSPPTNSSSNNPLLNHLLKNPVSTTKSRSGSAEKDQKQKSKSRSKEKNQQNYLQLYQSFQNNMDLNIQQNQELFIASSISSKSQGRTQKVDFFKKNNQLQNVSCSHSPYQTTSADFSTSKHQKSASQSRSKSNGKKKNGQKASSITPIGFFKNRTPSQSPPNSNDKNTTGQLRLQGSGSGGKSRSFDKNSNLNSTFNNTISSLINGLSGNNPNNQNKPPLKTGGQTGMFQSSCNTNKNNLNLHSVDKLYKTDFLSRLLDSTKSNVSSKKTSNITPKSCKTKISSSRNSQSKDNSSSIQNNKNSQSYQSNFNNQNSQTINSQSYNYNSNSNFSFAHPQKEGGSQSPSGRFDDESHQHLSYDETVYGNAGGCNESSKNCTLDFAEAFSNIDNQTQQPLKSQSLNRQLQNENKQFIKMNNYMNEQVKQQALLAQIAINNNQQLNKAQGKNYQNPQFQNNNFACSSARSNRRGSEGSYLPQQIDFQQNNSFNNHIQQIFLQQQQIPSQSIQKKDKGIANKENQFENSTDQLLDVLQKQTNSRKSTSAKQKKRSTSGGKKSGNQQSFIQKNAQQLSNSGTQGKNQSNSYQGSEKPNKFQPYKQSQSPNKRKRVSPNQRPSSSINQSSGQQHNQSLSLSSYLNTNHFSSTSQDSTSLQSQLKVNFNQTFQQQTSHNTSFQSKPPRVKKQQQMNNKEKEINMQNSGGLMNGNNYSIVSTPNSYNYNNIKNSYNNNPMNYIQNQNSPTKQINNIHFDQNQSFDETPVNTTL